VTAVQTRSRGSVAEMRFTVDVPDAAGLARTLAALRAVPGVQEAGRG
jgi:(p)ppGpp synthase/HD superfamily hydrolase